MKMKYLFLVMAAFFFLGCEDEDTIVPTAEDEMFYIFPQGNHSYDSTLVSWRDRYGIFALYDYNVDDLFWNATGWLGWTGETGNATHGNLEVVPADTNYIEPLLDMIYTQFLSSYDDELLREYFPLKIFLCQDLNYISSYLADIVDGEYVYALDTTRLNITSGYGCVAINGASSYFWEELPEEQHQDSIFSFYMDMNLWFLETLLDNDAIEYPIEEFAAVSADFYDVTGNDGRYGSWGAGYASYPIGEERFEKGFLNFRVVSQEDLEAKVEYDWEGYWYMVLNVPMDSLTAEPYAYWEAPAEPPTSFAGINWDCYYFGLQSNTYTPYPTNFKGILNPKRDKYGRCMEKYMIIVNWLQDEVGFDLDPIRYPDGKPAGAE